MKSTAIVLVCTFDFRQIVVFNDLFTSKVFREKVSLTSRTSNEHKN